MINNDYSNFYKGTYTLNQYGSATSDPQVNLVNTLVKYEFNTKDEAGNKIMDKMSREETLKVMKEISAQYGDHVIVEFSGDGMAALVEAKKGQWQMSEEDALAMAKRNEEFQKSIVHNTPRQIIPNIQTNDMLVKSLKGADRETVNAAYGIIDSYLLKRDVSGMSKEEWQDMIAFGVESAKYLAENKMDEEHAALFMGAIENIAKYGLNGVADENGKVKYNIEQGPPVGAPDDYVSQSDVLKAKNPELYKRMNDLLSRVANGEQGLGKEFMAITKEINLFMSSPVSEESSLSNADAAAIKYKSWKANAEKTKLPDTFKGVKYTDLQSFFDSLKNQSSLSNDWLDAGMLQLGKWLRQ